mmetsp:Transcript_25209/g.51459  ORF Transcript_25209/g.51459 Transcript_25209/m.51459 type:complete len:387 (+) Transcript_25209:40-1200(+)|eukprot:CAMPEP_0178681002 /NCGR_PEP_ID=MMETSP0699-20121125/999_1 /TAXON_ID=265572 /ORGANISM="Extubocellulus spinifer, Strain CCMP396" /LENGTH=386 /DNA_ID=CAMNT_0020325423 /DNA_START=39 /DNA_END=1199 /DNA_ORIENTATION=+
MSSSPVSAPTVVTDPRYRAARKLISTGRAADGAIEMLATLVEEAVQKYGEDSADAAAVYYEYGNALFRAAERRRMEEEDIMGKEDEQKPDDAKVAAAMAAEKRAATSEAKKAPGKQDTAEKVDEDRKPAASEQNADVNKSKDGTNDEENDGSEELSDHDLALELMENAFAIYDAYCAETDDADDSGDKKAGDAAKAKAKPYLTWVIGQLPRTLGGIGDVLISQDRHADGVDAYTRVVSLREAAVESYQNQKGGKDDATGTDVSIDFLKARRLLCEANILVAEALLACPRGEDVVTSETGDVLVKAGEILDYTQGYYDKARDELQETVFLMGKIATGTESEEFRLEKENVCYCAQMLGGVGNMLADKEGGEQEKHGEPPDAKKPKTG